MSRATPSMHVDHAYAAYLVARPTRGLRRLREIVCANVPRGESIYFDPHPANGFVFVYSTWFECIGPEVVASVRHILSEWDEDALFGTFSPPGNGLVMQRTPAGLQSVATGLWDYDAHANAFAVINGRAFAPWTPRGELFESVKGAFRAHGIDPERAATGYDSLMAGGQMATDANHAFDVGRGECRPPLSSPTEPRPVWVADLRGVYQLRVESLDHLSVFDPDLAGYSMASVAAGGAQLLSDHETTRYLITGLGDTGILEVNGMHHRLASRFHEGGV